jgi:hypothetical protein
MKLISSLSLVFLLTLVASVSGQTSAFTYQGRLTDTVAPPSATYDLEFALYDSASTLIGAPIQRNGTVVSDGVFTVSLDFGVSAFPGANRLLEIRVKRTGEPSYTPLTPRQLLTSAPYAIHAKSADTATSVIGGGGISFTSFIGGAIGSVPPNTARVFLGGTATITVQSADQLTVTASATLSQSTVTTVPVLINLCYRSGADTPAPMRSAGEQVIDVFNRRVTHTINYSNYVLPSAGTYEIGFCLLNGTQDTLNNNGNVTGWVMRLR